ncbi:SCO1664 family protein [Candidatus Chloroploca sp. Khr17]|uniref:SCO1664 family protein n=1 Tax=Candidatus Chloroploca sp. Khr17 TaxID=2496869 RepID=UPI001F114CB7|nr:SCO1664 family protein [Candidatus Chloroploca sp. Khr17]
MDEEMQPQEVSIARVLEALASGQLEVAASMPYSSNYTLLATVQHNGLELLGIYKPKRGERPLWDFPRGTLYKREAAAYVISEGLGFGLVPPTVVRDGPYGVGTLQLFISNDEESHLFTMLKEGGYDATIRRLCAFDCLVNNADRKSGHCLKGSDRRLWAIDHGLCFHVEPKLRTVIWDFVGEPLPPDVLDGLCRLRSRFEAQDDVVAVLDGLLDKGEVRALRRRLDRLITTGVFPTPGPGPNVPWPPV